MRTQDFDFYLPEALIAQHPAKTRNGSRLLFLNGKTGKISDQLFVDLPLYLNAGDLLVFNDTKVIKARLFGKKGSGGAIEMLIERVIDSHHVMAHIRASRAPKAGTILLLADAFKAEVLGRNDDLFHVKFIGDIPVLDLLERYGSMPLPPYITHNAEAEDETRYQTVYAKHAGAVAAPTAGLHFDEMMLKKLKEKGIHIAYVTLHVGAGTFQPVRVENIHEHKMHSEIYNIPPETVEMIESTKTNGGKIVAVGTTSMRTLESAAQTERLESGRIKHGQNKTDIFITPGYEFKIVDKLITNFHLPKSTLLMLVSAFAGFDEIKNAYAHAVKQEYRFFSYGDAMLLERKAT
jgi:S-adenosylmethionine:tRNA ribosyltransferase-isomerase